MLFKSRNLNYSPTEESWALSLLFHSVLIGGTVFIFCKSPYQKNDAIEMDVIETPQIAHQPIQASPSKPSLKKDRGHPVFGITRKSSESATGEQVKRGNTLAKTPDTTQLNKTDQDRLPIPSEDYLITQMPILKSDIRIPYPKESKKNGVQGVVVMDLLIDSTGKVREVNLVEGPNSEINEAALSAAKNFLFHSALIRDQPVAVRIRYAYRFVLER